MVSRKKILKDFDKAVTQLERVLKKKSANKVIQAGCIQYFEFSFELAWKTIKVFAEYEGLQEAISPKTSLQQAFTARWIDHEKPWLDMLQARNLMSHIYSGSDALVIYKKLPIFADELRSLAEKLKKV